MVTSPLRNLLLAILGYQRKPFFVTIPRFSNCVSFLKVIETFLDGFMSVYTKSALSQCPLSRTIALCLTVPVVNFSENGHQHGLFRYISNEDYRDKMDVEVNQCHSVPLGDRARAVAASLPAPRKQSPPRSPPRSPARMSPPRFPPHACSRSLSPRPARAVVASLLALDSSRTRRRGCTRLEQDSPARMH
jgi:hypothetical protein